MNDRQKILLTPSFAKELLSNNFEQNRKIRHSVVVRYATDIKEGRWNPEVSGVQDPIIISKNGQLLNGQHRCSAVVEANTPIYIYVARNIDEGIFKYLDDGEKRGARDYIHVPNAHSVASLAKIMYAVENGDAPLSTALVGKYFAKKGTPNVARQQILSKVDEDPERILEYVRLGMRAGAYLANKKGHISAALFIIDFCERGDSIDRFVNECSIMVPSAPAVIALRSYVSNCLSSKNFKADCKWMCGCIFAAYEAFRNNSEIKSFNKASLYFSQYDKYVSEIRKKYREDNYSD